MDADKESPLDGKYPLPGATPEENALFNWAASLVRDPSFGCPGCGTDMLMAEFSGRFAERLPDGGYRHTCPNCGRVATEKPVGDPDRTLHWE